MYVSDRRALFFFYRIGFTVREYETGVVYTCKIVCNFQIYCLVKERVYDLHGILRDLPEELNIDYAGTQRRVIVDSHGWKLDVMVVARNKLLLLALRVDAKQATVRAYEDISVQDDQWVTAICGKVLPQPGFRCPYRRTASVTGTRTRHGTPTARKR